jgi:uncharacterized Tic20 family protein
MTEPTPQPAATPAAPLTEAEDKQWASFAHFGNILVIAPLIIWLIFKDRGAKTNVEGKEAVNWSITYVIGWVVLFILVSILTAALLFTAPGLITIVGLLPWAWWILNVLFAILGGVKVNGGGSYRYPFALRFIK